LRGVRLHNDPLLRGSRLFDERLQRHGPLSVGIRRRVDENEPWPKRPGRAPGARMTHPRRVLGPRSQFILRPAK
jgi:hypothetical protein